MKKILCLVIAFLFLVGFSSPAYAVITPDDAVVTAPQTREEIDNLFALRRKLEHNYEANQTLIDRIDQQLEALGVEEVSYQYVLNKLGYDAMPCVDVESTDTVRWTSNRHVLNYQGILYELQILEAVPCATSSPLQTTPGAIPHSAAGLTAGLTNVLGVITITALGSVPVIGDVVGAGTTLFDCLNEKNASLETSTVIDNADGTALASITTHVKYIFVKRYGSEDTGNQVLCYIGSSIDYWVSTTTALVKYDEYGEKIIDEPVYARIDGSAASLYYNDLSPHVQVYHNYKVNGVSNFKYVYHLTTLSVEACGATLEFDIPLVYPNYV